MKKIICFIIINIILIILIPRTIYARDETDVSSILKEQTSDFGIQDFLKETEKYIPDNEKNIDVSEIFSEAISGNINNTKIIKKVFKLFGIELTEMIKIIVEVLIIVLIHSILKSITENLENTRIANIVYYAQYALIVTIIMKNFSIILNLIRDSIEKMVGFSNLLIPLLNTLMIFTGNITTISIIEPILLFLIYIISNFIKLLILPIISIISVLIIVSQISERVQIKKLSVFMKNSVIWTLGIILTLFVGILSLEGNLASSVDGITAKTTKAAVSSLIPIIGKVIGDGVDAILGCGVILKNAVGIIGVFVVIWICLNPIIKLSVLSITYSLLSAIIEPIADNKIVKLFDEISGVFKLLLAVLTATSALLIIGITLVIKISNSGMMYR